MNPRLVVIAGQSEGAIFALAEEDVSIGRERSNQLWINDVSVSRRHSVIKKDADRFKLVDLGSYNGTRVNGVPIKERYLEHGDLITMGDSLLLFLLHEETEASPAQGSFRLDEGSLGAEPTVMLRREDALYLHPEKVLAALPPTARVAHDLNALLKISAAINSIRDREALHSRLLESIFEVIPAERGAVLIAESEQTDFSLVAGWDRSTGTDRPIQVSRTIVRQVFQQGVAVLSSSVLEDQAFDQALSLRAFQTRSLLCVPLAIFDKVFGVIYLDTSDRFVRFDEGHLQLATAIAAVAAVALENIHQLELLQEENRRLHEDINIERNMVGESSHMNDVYQFIGKVAPTDSTVLIYGESGTGKELAARATHLNSPRADKPFVAINCAALTDTLLESELFGHEKGAFTGAIVQKKGKLEVADQGTVFLDEIGELSPLLQAKLLRVLQEREFERVGGTRPIKVNIRLIAATNKDLEEAIRNGEFRKDLFYRLNVVRLTMPPLRDRKEDIPLLANYFATKYGDKCNRKVRGISAEARDCLMAYDWPGNVRELENAIERAVVLGSTNVLLAEDLPEAVLEVTPPSGVPAMTFYEAVKDAKKQVILRAIEQANGNYIEAARLLGVHPNNLHRLIRNLNLRSELKKQI